MRLPELHASLTQLFNELVDGPAGEAFMLNTGDAGLLRSLDKLTATDASRSTNQGATIAAHAQHVRYGLSLMNKWAAEGGNPFADAKWDEAWKLSSVDDRAWQEIRKGLADECRRWSGALKTERELAGPALLGTMGSIAHLAYHLGAIRQIDKTARGPRDGTF
jgi:hypothetical protein